MKICYITNLYPPHVRGGAERVVFQVAQQMRARGHEVVVITSAPRAEVVADEGGIRVHRVFHGSLYFNLDSDKHWLPMRLCNLVWTFINPFFSWKVRQILKKEQPDVVHTHNLAGTSFYVPRIIRSQGIPHVHTVHDIQLAVPSGRMVVGQEYTWMTTGFAARVFRAAQQWLWGSPAVVTTPSEWLLSFYRTRGYFPRSHMQLVRHISLAVLPPAPPEPRERFTLTYVGQLERAKGVCMVVDLYAELQQAGAANGTELVIVGDGTDAPYVRAQAAAHEHIQVLGAMSHEQAQKIIATSDVVVVPSLLYENSPNVIIEALAAHRPVSVSDVGGAAELVKETHGGWVIEPTEEAWRAHLIWLLRNMQTVVQQKPQLPAYDMCAQFEQVYDLITHSHN